MDRQVRWNDLLELLARHGRLSVHHIAKELGVSMATVRRDLDELAQQQLLSRTRGGAIANGVAYDLPLRYKAARNAPEKERIAQAAARLVAPGLVVGLNGGTTTTAVARAIAARPDLLRAGNGRAVTVVTNALNIANELAIRPQIKTVVTGGVARTRSYELIGPLTGSILKELTLDMVFLGVDGFDPAYGATAHNEEEATTNRLMVARAREVTVVADASKLGTRAFARICDAADVNTVITDARAADGIVSALEDAGVRVVRAGAGAGADQPRAGAR